MRRFPLLALRLLCCTAMAACVEYEPVGGVGNDGTAETSVPGGPPKEADIPEGSTLDAFDLPRGGTIDVIVFGDNSSSMEEELRTLGETITPFVERLATQVSDWQLAAITGNTGCVGSGVLTPDTPDYAKKFADAITTPTGEEDEDEAAFSNVAKVVENSGPGDCNEGLVRGDLLHLIFVSDENDESPGFNDGQNYWREYWDRIVAVHGDPGSIVISAVAGPTPNGCERPDEDADADPGEGYDDAVAETGGEFLSICSDWASQIDVLADAGTVRTEFPLSETPKVDTIQVWINQVEKPPGVWIYDAAGNRILFLQEAPRPGDTVDVLYERL